MPSLANVPTLNRRTAVRLGSAGLAAAVSAGGQRSAAALEHTALEANKAIARRVFDDVFNERNVAALEELYAPDVVDRGAWARHMPGPAGMPVTLDRFHALFPDVTVTVDVAIAEDDLVATRETWRGTHPPAGTHVVGRTMHIFRIANEQIVEQWSTGWEWLAHLDYRSESRPANPLAGA